MRLTKANYYYTRYQLQIDESEQPEVLLAALLPCQWIYQYIYQENLSHEIPYSHPYYDWLKVYQEPKFKMTTHKLIELANILYEQAPDIEREKMLDAFTKSSQFELDFWRDAYTGNYR